MLLSGTLQREGVTRGIGRASEHLAALGGPFGMVGGIAMLGIMTLVSSAVAEYGMDAIFIRVVRGLVADGVPVSEIRRKIRSYPISSSLKRKILEHLDEATG